MPGSSGADRVEVDAGVSDDRARPLKLLPFKDGALTGARGSHTPEKDSSWSGSKVTAVSPQVCPRVPEGV